MNKTFEAAILKIAPGSSKNSYIRLTGLLGLFPKNTIGGSSYSTEGKLITLKIGRHIVETDIDGTKPFFRNRSVIAKFLNDEGIIAGDYVIVRREGSRSYTVSKVSHKSILSFL